MSSRTDPRLPVLVGAGTCIDHVEAVELMARATVAAADDAGAPSLLHDVQRITVPRGTWAYTDPARVVAHHIGAPRATTVLVDLGIPQQTLINEAMTAIRDGTLDVVVVVGAEAKARAARDPHATELDQHGAEPDVLQQPQGEIVARAEIAARLWTPVQQYALMESALRAADGVTVEQDRWDVAALWARFNEVARDNPEAAFRESMTADELAKLGPGNRPLAFPYGKWHASQWTVDQGAALLLCAAEVAERHGVPRERWVLPRAGLDSSFALPLSARREMHRWPAMQVVGRAASARIGRPLAACEHVELYSCFPVAVRVQQRELGLPASGTPTITGGMTFAGGPFNNFVLQATAAMVRRLRADGGLGLVTTVSGLLTKPGLAVWATDDDGEPPLIADLARDAEAATARVDVLDSYDGDATVAACTVTYDGEEPRELVAILDTQRGARVIARSDDPVLAARATEEELVGTRVAVAGNGLVA